MIFFSFLASYFSHQYKLKYIFPQFWNYLRDIEYHPYTNLLEGYISPSFSFIFHRSRCCYFFLLLLLFFIRSNFVFGKTFWNELRLQTDCVDKLGRRHYMYVCILFMFICQYLHINISLNVSINFCLRMIFRSFACVLKLLLALWHFPSNFSPSLAPVIYRYCCCCCSTSCLFGSCYALDFYHKSKFFGPLFLPHHIYNTHFIICFVADAKNDELSVFNAEPV